MEHVTTAVVGEDTSCKVYFDFAPEEGKTYEYPGCEAEVVINAVEVDGNDISEDLSQSCLKRIEEVCFEQIEREAHWV